MKLAIPVYLANAYSAGQDYPNNPDFSNLIMLQRRGLESYVAGQLKKKFKNKYCFLLPIAMSASIVDICSLDSGFSVWEKDDYTWISICQEVWVLVDNDGAWTRSVGVQAEITFAEKIGKPIKYINPNTFQVTKTAPNCIEAS